MTEPLPPFPEPSDVGGILSTMDAVGDLSAFLTGQRGMPLPHQIVTYAYLDPAKIPDYADRLRLLELVAAQHGLEVHVAGTGAGVTVEIPRSGPVGPRMLWQLYTVTPAGVRDPL